MLEWYEEKYTLIRQGEHLDRVNWSRNWGELRALDKIYTSRTMAVEVVEQMWNLTTRAVERMQFQSSRIYVDVHQTAGVGLAISFGLPLLVLASFYYWFGASILFVKSSKSGLQVPPGNPWMLPLCGETFQIAMNFDSYLKSRIQRYGEIFTSHIFGAPSVLVTSIEGIKHVLASPHHKNFNAGFPPTVKKFLGPQSLTQAPATTPMHTYLRRLYSQRVKAENIASIIPNIDAVVQNCLNSWAELRTVKAYPEFKKVIFRIALVFIFGDDRPGREETEILHQHMVNVFKGMASVPFNIPGTPYGKAIKALKAIHDHTERVMEKRRGTKGDSHVLHEDLLEGLMNCSIPEEGITGLTDAQIRDNVLLAMVAAHDTSACALTWLLKFLAESPDDLQEIIAEHQAIAASKGSKEYELTYDDILRMPASLRAFLETNRLITPTFGVSRKAINDVELNGKFIPKGWSVLLLFQPTHFNPKFYPDPCKFNPSRFKESAPQPGTFLAFGSGPRLCPGQDLAKTNALVVLHRLVVGYRWELLGNSDGGKKFPTPVPKGDLPITINRMEEEELLPMPMFG